MLAFNMRHVSLTPAAAFVLQVLHLSVGLVACSPPVASVPSLALA